MVAAELGSVAVGEADNDAAAAGAVIPTIAGQRRVGVLGSGAVRLRPQTPNDPAHGAGFGISKILPAAGHVRGRIGWNPQGIISRRRAVEQLRPRRGVFVGVAGIEHIFEIGFKSALIAVRQVMFICQFHRQFAPVRSQIGVAIVAHRRNLAAVIGGIHFERQAEGVQLNSDPRHFRFFLRAGQRGQQQRRQNADDGNDHQQFNQ